MKKDMIFSGFGGQGVLTIGKFLAQAAMKEGKKVSWLPSYGPEMRGGTANVAVVISDEEIASPLISHPDFLLALNQPSLDKFGPETRAGGLIIVNSDMSPNKLQRDDVEIFSAPMSTIAVEIGSSRVINMLAIGMIIGKTKIVSFETIEKEIREFLEKKSPEMLAANLQAIKKGIELFQ